MVICMQIQRIKSRGGVSKKAVILLGLCILLLASVGFFFSTIMDEDSPVKPDSIESIIREEAQSLDFPCDLAVVLAEFYSSKDPSYGKDLYLSGKPAGLGLFSISSRELPLFSSYLGRPIDPFSPQENTRAALIHLKKVQAEGHSLLDSLVIYHFGRLSHVDAEKYKKRVSVFLLKHSIGH